MSPFNNLLCMLLGISFTVWFTLLLVFIIVPAIFGLSFGIRNLYMKTLLKVFEVSVRSSCSLSGWLGKFLLLTLIYLWPGICLLDCRELIEMNNQSFNQIKSVVLNTINHLGIATCNVLQ